MNAPREDKAVTVLSAASPARATNASSRATELVTALRVVPAKGASAEDTEVDSEEA